MSQTMSRPATAADIEALPPNVVGEIAFGALHTHPRPTPRHSVAANAVGSTLTGRFQFGIGGPAGWLFMVESELHLGPHILVPDLAGWRRERLPRLPDTAYIDTPPDWVCEVLSPATARFDRTDKLAIYSTFGVAHCWYVDPIVRTLEVLALQGDKWLLTATFKDTDAVCAPPFEAHTFQLDLLWAD
jgi:Putative restriction endonuclease